MPPIALAVIQIYVFLRSHKDEIKQLILDIEELAEGVAGPTKAAGIKAFIASALGIEAHIEAAWPIVAPIFNGLVAVVKGKAAAAPAAAS